MPCSISLLSLHSFTPPHDLAPATLISTLFHFPNFPHPAVKEEHPTHQDRALSSQLPIQSALERPLHGRAVGVRQAHNTAQAEDDADEGAHEDEALLGGEVGVLVGGEDAEDVVILVDELAEVAALLLIPPVGVGVAELALLGRGVGVAAVLLLLVSER